jgi:hypothetical protein
VAETLAGTVLVSLSTAGVYTVNLTALATTTTPAINIENTTAAALGAQQVSPSFVWTSQGWETNTSASQPVAFQAFVLPVQGAANPSGTWELQASINNGAYANVLTVTSAGVLGGCTVPAALLTGTISDALLPTTVTSNTAPVTGKWLKYTLAITATGTLRVTAPDGTHVDTALSGSSQSVSIRSMAAGETLSLIKYSVPTAFTGSASQQMSVGWTGGDTSNGGAATTTTGYVTNTSLASAYTSSTAVNPAALAAQSPCRNETTTWSLTITIQATNLALLTAGQFNLTIYSGQG